MNKILIVNLLAFLVLSVAPYLSAQQQPVEEELLLEDLGTELLEPSTIPDVTTWDDRLIKQLGEDVGESRPATNGWTADVVRHMEQAQRLLEQRSAASDAASAQAEALAGLDAVIQELTERKRQYAGDESAKMGQPEPGKNPGSLGKPGNSPASAASSVTGNMTEVFNDSAATGELVRGLWGQLPERQREQILQPLREEFLPAYRKLIAEYYRRLADRGEQRE